MVEISASRFSSRLEELGWQVLPVMMPGTNPDLALQELLDRELPPIDWFQPLDCIDDTKILLVVDQFEEVFTLCRDRSERSKFIQALMNLNVWVVVTMRADFVESCLTDAGLMRSIQQDAVYLGPLMGVDLEAAIEQPAIVQGIALQPKLLAQILQDVAAEENCLPLLEFALSELWERPLTPNSGGIGPDFGFKATGTEGLSIRELTLTDYRKLGGVVGALNAHAEGIYKQLAVQKREVWVQRVMLKLVRTGEGTKDTRQRQRRDDLLGIAKDDAEREAIESVIMALVDGRLLVSDRIDNQDVIDLSHEALMRSWKQLVTWRESGREVRRIVDAIEDAKRKWIEQGKKRRDLLEGRLLKDGRRLLKDAPADVFGAKGFIRKSLWVRRSEFASWMIIPILVLGIPAEYSWRENEIKKDYDRIDQLGNGELGERLAVLNIAGGCWAQQQFSIAPEPSMAAELFPEHSKSKDRQYLQLLDNFLKYFRERAFGNCRLLDRANLSGVDLGNDGWINLGKPGLYLGGASLYKANLSGANLVGTNLSNATLDKADLSGASLIGTNLSRANLDRANLSNARLDGTNLSGASFNKGGLMESHLNNVNLSRVSSYAANWSGAKFKSSNLRGASFNQVDLSRANFDRSNLSGASFKVSNLSGANFQGVNLENVEFQCFKYGDQTIPRKGDCTNLKDIKWDKNTNWKNIKGWETVENIPPALKQQLGLK